MLEITEETRRAFLSDNSHKELSIEFEGGVNSLEEINYFVGTEYHLTYPGSTAHISADSDYTMFGSFSYYPENSEIRTDNMKNSINDDKLSMFNYWYFAIDIQYINGGITQGSADITYTGPIYIYIDYVKEGVSRYYYAYYNNTSLINRFVNGEKIRLYVRGFTSTIGIPFTHIDDNNYVKKIRVQFPIHYSNVAVDSGYSEIKHSYGFAFDRLAFNLSNTASSTYVFPPYAKSQIINGVYPLFNIHNENLMLESFQLTESICSKDNLKFGLSEAASCSFNVVDTKDDYINKIFRAYITCENTQKIPLGKFRITEVSKETKYNLVTRAITAYDEMIDWDKDATDWYADYMFGVSSNSYSFGGFEFARQMFSTYYNFAKFLGYEDDNNYVEELVYDSGNISNLPATIERYSFAEFTVKVSNTNMLCHNWGDMQKFEINNVSSDYLYKFKKTNTSNFSDDWVWENWFGFMKKDVNPKKGILTNASVMVEEVLDDSTYNRYLVNADDYFAISDNCVKLNIYYATHVQYENAGASGITNSFIDEVYVYRTPCPDWVKLLVNKSARLVYYDWETLEWQTPTCTIRDVFRSLMEINGAFVKINRQGDVECVYSRKGSLYPSETLYPSEDLYPIEDAMMIPSAKYSASQQEDYQSADFGKIQVKSQNNNKDSITIRTFVGDANYDSTYIIDDNVFFCNSAVKFNYRDNVNGQSVTPYDVLPELNIILGRMFNRISNMGYTPHNTTLIGMPWVETGDRVTLITYQDAFESFVFRRTLQGIQGLFDTYEAQGDNIIEAYKEVEV